MIDPEHVTLLDAVSAGKFNDERSIEIVTAALKDMAVEFRRGIETPPRPEIRLVTQESVLRNIKAQIDLMKHSLEHLENLYFALKDECTFNYAMSLMVGASSHPPLSRIVSQP
jgi:hypothetical protein